MRISVYKMLRTLTIISIVAIVTAFPGGKQNGRVIGGQDAVAGAYPYMVSLRDRVGHSCGGCIITNRTILTAAHCIEGYRPSDLSVATGSIFLDSGSVFYRPIRLIAHEKYNTFTVENDVGLIIVDRDIVFDSNTQPINLGRQIIGVGIDILLTGWGTTSYPGVLPNNLQYIYLRTISTEDCRTAYEDINPVYDNQLCTLNSPGEGGCHFDSGSPVVFNNSVVGLANWGFACAAGYPDVNARVSSHLRWIDFHKL